MIDASNPVTADPGHASPHYFGCAWADYDGDGDIDLFVDTASFYRNDGNGQFTKILGSGLGSGQVVTPSFSMSGWSWGDYDRDGDLDAFIAGERSYLYRNDGSDVFTRITTGDIGNGLGNRGWTCAWGDYDNDGNLDLIIVHPAGGIPPFNSPLPNQMFHADGGPDFTFTELFSGPIVTGLDSYTVGTWADWDDDGDLDFSIGSGLANGTLRPDHLYRNLLVESGSADFENLTDAPLATDLQDGQVWNWIDYDNDGDLDAYVTNWGGPIGGVANRLYRQESDGTFTTITGQPITDDVRPSLSSIWEDFDNDGDLDCYVGNDNNNQDRLYENLGNGTFVANASTPITVPGTSRRSACAGDYDNDGDVDLFVNGPASARALYRNDDTSGNGYLEIMLVGTTSSLSGIGAKIHLLATIGGQAVWQRRDISAQNSFNGHSDQRAHFGLGDATTIDSLVVEWPSGFVTRSGPVSPNQFLTVVEEAPASAEDAAAWIAPDLETAPNPFRETSEIHGRISESGSATLTVHDASGRLIRTLFANTAPERGELTVRWDGTDAQGRSVPAGVYWYRLESGQSSVSRTVIRIR
ncbi:MAG: FG-GAP-like repeat-containing protein [Candidatus Eisenbacteria bacterium]